MVSESGTLGYKTGAKYNYSSNSNFLEINDFSYSSETLKNLGKEELKTENA